MILSSAAPINVSRACRDFHLSSAAETSLMESRGKARSLSLDLYDQWETMEKDGKWRFTSPTHVVLAFAQALQEMEEEGGIPARARRYRGEQPSADRENGRTGHPSLYRKGTSGTDHHDLPLSGTPQFFVSRICISISKTEDMRSIRER